MRTFDELNELFSNLTEEDYRLTEMATSIYHLYGDKSLLEFVSEKTKLLAEEILAWWWFCHAKK